jgi:prephenate dehydrogenase
VASAYLLPQLASASLLNATVEQPGWKDVQKIASRAYFSASAAFSEQDDAETLSTLSFQNRENLLRAVDRMIQSMLVLRDDLENKDKESFKTYLKEAQGGRAKWMSERIKGEWVDVKSEKVEKISIMEMLLGSTLGKRFKPKDE